MAGTYKITEVVSQTADKYSVMVEYNGKDAEHVEIDLDILPRTLKGLQEDLDELIKNKELTDEIEQEIKKVQAWYENPANYAADQLQQIADNDEERTAKEEAPVSDIVVEDGQVVAKEYDEEELGISE